VSVLAALTISLAVNSALQTVGINDTGGGFILAFVLPVLVALLYQALATVGIWRSASGRGILGILARTWIVLVVSLFVLKWGGLAAFLVKGGS
jgi:hypothetical protein